MDSQNKKQVNYWMIIAVILFVLLIGTTAINILSVKKEAIEPVSVSPEPTKVKQSYQLKYGKEIEDTLSNIFNNRVSFDKKKDGVSYFQKEFDFLTNSQDKWQRLNVISYLYKEGESKFNEGYEGSQWTVDLDDVVTSLVNLKPGTQISKIYDATIAYDKAEITFSRLGNRDWARYDTYFKPGGNWDRHYVTYDKDTSKLVFVTFSFVYYNDVETHKTDFTYNQKEGYFTDVKYPEEISSMIRELEIILSQN